MVLVYPDISRHATPEPDEEAGYGTIAAPLSPLSSTRSYGDKSTALASPEPHHPKFDTKAGDEKRNVEIGWTVMADKQEREEEQMDEIATLVGNVKTAYGGYFKFLVSLCIIEIVLVILFVVFAPKCKYTCVLIIVFKLALLIRCSEVSRAVAHCRTWLKQKFPEMMSSAKKQTKVTKKKESEKNAPLSKDPTPRTIVFRRGGNGMFGIQHARGSIREIDEESTARHLMQRGDQILFLNGIDIETFTNDELTKMIKAVSGEMRLVIRYNPERLAEMENA